MAAKVFIDGIELLPPAGSGTSAIEGSVTRRLNLPSQTQVKVPQHLAIGGVGSRIKVEIDGTLWHHGFVTVCETEAEEDTGYTVYNSEDPMELWRWRPCRDFLGPTPGNMIDPHFPFRLRFPGFEELGNSGPQMLLEVLFASENPVYIPTAAEGPLFLQFGGFESGGVNLSGGFTNWPMTIAELASMLVSTGEMDIVITPIDSGGNMGVIDVYNGNYGADRTGSVHLEYGQGAHNIKHLRWNEDLANVTNKLQYFFGPKPTIRRYQANITGDDPCLPYTVGATEMADLQTRRLQSRSDFGVRMEIQEYDVDTLSRERTVEGNGLCEYLDPVRSLFRVRWYRESAIRVEPRKLYHVTPISDYGINAFGIGDRIRVSCTPVVRGGFSGIQRIYELTVNWTGDSVLELSELVVSPDQEGI